MATFIECPICGRMEPESDSPDGLCAECDQDEQDQQEYMENFFNG